MSKKELLLAGDAFGILNTMNSFNVRTRGDNKILDGLEELLIKAIEGKTTPEEPTDVSIDSVKILTEEQFENFTDGVAMPRGNRKRLEVLLVK